VSRRPISFVIAMALMARLSFGASPLWADHVVIFDEQHLRHLLNCYKQYCNESRAHLSVKKDAPIPGDARGEGTCSPCRSRMDFTIEFKYPAGTEV
jgi:hypothetical protein